MQHGILVGDHPAYSVVLDTSHRTVRWAPPAYPWLMPTTALRGILLHGSVCCGRPCATWSRNGRRPVHVDEHRPARHRTLGLCIGSRLPRRGEMRRTRIFWLGLNPTERLAGRVMVFPVFGLWILRAG